MAGGAGSRSRSGSGRPPLAQLYRECFEPTENHYAHWIPEGDEYWPPIELGPGEVPADVLARLVVSNPTVTRLEDVARDAPVQKPSDSLRNGWIPGEDLNLDSQVQSLLSCR